MPNTRSSRSPRGRPCAAPEPAPSRATPFQAASACTPEGGRSPFSPLAALLLAALPALAPLPRLPFPAPLPVGPGPAAAGEAAPRVGTAGRVAPGTVRVDGSLDEGAWSAAPFVSDFVQKIPDEGSPSTRVTEVGFLYDEEALYVGARMKTEDPGSIRAIVSRRDNAGNSERLIVSLDTYHDHRTAYSFAVTSSGVRIDYYHPRDAEMDRDYSFDPVWEARTQRCEDGWTAEMRIPFSQLRFDKREEQVWGLNLNRWIPDRNEDTYWVCVPAKETGWASRFGELRGIRGIRPSRRIEVLPYAAADARFDGAIEEGDPFGEKTSGTGRTGADLKMGLGPNLTLEGTVNPDFGQVEADPAVVNLTAYETVFEERRPFFVEGNRLLSGDGASYYYSRRIGAPPHGEPEADWIDAPWNTTILGAAKMTGRAWDGLSIGALGAVTDVERARIAIDSTGERKSVRVEPRAGYGVLRLQQEFGEDRSTAGLMVTGVGRDLEPGEALESELARSAVAGGADWRIRFRDKKYTLGGSIGGSRVAGERMAIAALQNSSVHYYQRPDAPHVRLDSSRTSLSGHTYALWLTREAGAHWLWEVGSSGESPGFEINDLGRLQSADDRDAWGGLVYRETKPGRVFRDYDLRLAAYHAWNYGGLPTDRSADVSLSATWKNHWRSWVGAWGAPRNWSDDLTRGGPVVQRFKSWEVWAGAQSNYASNRQWRAEAGYSRNEIGALGWEAEGSLSLRTKGRYEVSIEPEYHYLRTARQYVDTFDGGPASMFGKRYVFAWIEQSELVARLRLNIAFTPDLTLEVYAEPFAASGRYFDHGEFRRPRDRYLLTYGEEGGSTIVRNEDGTRTVGIDGTTFDLDNLDFNYLSFRSNLVLRWEWRRGSTLYLVWQQSRESDEESGSLVGGRDLGSSLRAPGDHLFAIKASYWFALD